LHVGSVLHGGIDPGRKGGGDFCTASLTGAFGSAVFGDLEFDGRNVEDLPYFISGGLSDGAF